MSHKNKPAMIGSGLRQTSPVDFRARHERVTPMGNWVEWPRCFIPSRQPEVMLSLCLSTKFILDAPELEWQSKVLVYKSGVEARW